MLVGKWNKSVFLTYVGLISSVIGMTISFSLENGIKYAFICFIIAGVCDMFDGFVARKCKRTKEEKAFGIQLDSLVDVISFIVFPIVLMIHMGFLNWYNILIYCIYAICGIARLGYFNIIAENTKKTIEYYLGLPVTFSALIFTIVYVTKIWIDSSVFNMIYSFVPLILAILFVVKIKLKKPRGIAYVFFSIIAIGMIPIYLFVL